MGKTENKTTTRISIACFLMIFPKIITKQNHISCVFAFILQTVNFSTIVESKKATEEM